MSERTYSVPGVSCEKCKSAIEGEVSGVDGVAQVEVDVRAKTVRVVGDAADDVLRSAIDRAGYDVVG